MQRDKKGDNYLQLQASARERLGKGNRLYYATVATKKTATVAVLARRKKRKGDGLATTVAMLARQKEGKETA